jgi:hypothetical protein
MTTIQIISRKFGVYFAKPILSLIVNCVFWLFHLNKISLVRREMEILKRLQLTTVMNLFQWKQDNLIDWTPWVSTIVYNNMTDDCDGAAILAKWHFKTKGIESKVFHLYTDKIGHAICVTDDHTKFVSNSEVAQINPASWREDIMKYFANKYEVMI